jgi:hypothetical protein
MPFYNDFANRAVRGPAPRTAITLRLVTTEGRTCKRFITTDGRYQVFADDLGTRRPAGAVWSWRPSVAHWNWTPTLRPFGTRRECLADLALVIQMGGHLRRAIGGRTP